MNRLTSILIAACLAPGAAIAADGSVSPGYLEQSNSQMMEDMDTVDADGDGLVSEQEHVDYRDRITAQIFDDADSDNDGMISKEEHAAADMDIDMAAADANDDAMVSDEEYNDSQSRITAQVFSATDSDGDGMLSEDEMKSAVAQDSTNNEQAALAAMDADGDGMVSEQEFNDRQSRITAQVFGQADTDGDGMLSEDEMKSAMGQQGEDKHQEAMENMDADGDSMVSEQEFNDHQGRITTQVFGQTDSNDDDMLSEDEMKAAMEKNASGQ